MYERGSVRWEKPVVSQRRDAGVKDKAKKGGRGSRIKGCRKERST